MDNFIKLLNSGVEDWYSGSKYFDKALDYYKSLSCFEREQMKATIFNKYNKVDSLVRLRFMEIICQCAFADDIIYMKEIINTAPLHDVFFIGDLVLKSSIINKEFLEALCLRFVDCKCSGNDFRIKTIAKIAYRLFFSLNPSKITREMHEGVFDLNIDSINDIINAIHDNDLNTIYLFNASNKLKVIRNICIKGVEAIICIDVDAQFFMQIIHDYNNVGYQKYAHYNKPVAYVIFDPS